MPSVDAKGDALEEQFKSLSSQLICEPIDLEDKIIIHIAEMNMGFGTNMNQTGENVKKDCLERHAVGGGVGILPFAVLIISKGICGPEGVKVMALPPQGESLSDIAYNLAEKMIGHKMMQEKRTDDMVAIQVE